MLPPFLLLDRYDVRDIIGQGGHATVFRAHDRVLERDVAIKVLREESVGPDSLARFRQEIAVTAQLEHAHILHVYDTGEYQGMPFLVTELASGRTLADRLSRERILPLDDALSIASEVGLALSHAHARGIIHRDVKPDNILLGSGGAILADFGIARLTGASIAQKLTSTGIAVGTVQYMSPEQLCAEPQLDARSDLYSLACVLYEMICGVPPHVSATAEGLRLLRITATHAPVSVHRPSVPPHIDAAILRALSSVPADRFRSMDEFLEAVDRKSIAESPTSAANLTRDNLWRRAGWSTRLAAIGAAALGLAGLFAASRYLAARDPVPTASVSASEQVVLSDPVDAEPEAVRFHQALRSEVLAWTGVKLMATSSFAESSVGITPEILTLGDSVKLRVRVTRSALGLPRVIEMTLASSQLSTAAALAEASAMIVRRALSGIDAENAPGLDALPDRSLVALRLYTNGFEELRAGRLAASAAAFRRSAEASPKFAYALFWAAQTGHWSSPRTPAAWSSQNAAAVALGTLAGHDSLLAIGLGEILAGKYDVACRAYFAAVSRDPSSFVGWFGLGECQRLDSIVVVTREKTHFRSSHWSALRAYQRVVETAPTSEWIASVFAPMLQTTYAVAGRARAGYRLGASDRLYYALPHLESDTLAFHPVPDAEFQGMGAATVPTSWTAALRRGRSVALNLTGRWLDRFPGAADAWLQRALVLELDGKILRGSDGLSADDALDRAQFDSMPDVMRARFQVVRTRLALRRGEVAEARRLAQDALAEHRESSAEARVLLAPLASFVGDGETAATYSVVREAEASSLPPTLAQQLFAFQMRAVHGMCDQLSEARRHLVEQFAASLAESERSELQRRRLLPALRAAAPCLGPAALEGVAPATALDSILQWVARGDSARARSALKRLRDRRGGARVGAITWDYLFLESWLLSAVGDSATARVQLTDALADIASMSQFTLDRVEQAAGLRRGILLLNVLPPGVETASGRGAVEQLWRARAKVLMNP